MHSIFDETPNWSYSQRQKLVEAKLSALESIAAANLPLQVFSSKVITFIDEYKQQSLYAVLKTMPKGCLHHIHFDCCEDEQFYANHVITDPIVYLTKEMDEFRIGTAQQAHQGNWLAMKDARKFFESDKDFVRKVSNLTMLNKADYVQMTLDQEHRWTVFEKKIQNFFPILGAAHLFKKYTEHVLRKYVRNGYDRIEFRSLLTKLNEYDQQGNLLCMHEEKKFMEIFDQAFNIVKKQHEPLTVSFIFFGLKMLSQEQNEEILTTALKLKWHRTIGIDFVQQQNPYGDQKPYDEVADVVLAKFPELDIKKVYHVGQTREHKNCNIKVAIEGGSFRIGHGINIVQHPHLLQVCREKKICFEKCPFSNLFLTYCSDPRQGTSPLLQGLGIPVTINPDDPGKFGYEDSTIDYFLAMISYNWTLKNLKLTAIHSINHSICSQQVKQGLLESFHKRWNDWIEMMLNQQ